jgi:uroporphyrinogen decarboxylase
LACEITLQPIDLIGLDVAILFSDILVIPQGMGLEVQMVASKGPILPKTIASYADIKALRVQDAEDDFPNAK